MKKILQLLIKIALLTGIICLMMSFFSKVLRPHYFEAPDDMTNKTEGFYALEDNSLDVLFMGSSHAYYTFNPSLLWKQTGAYSYIFAGECQPISQTYYYLKQALHTQRPQVIVMDVFGLMESSRGCQTDGIYKKNSEGLKNEKYRIQSVKEISNQDLLMDYIFDLRLYHSRWNELTLEDFRFPYEKHFNPMFGFTMGHPYSDTKIERDVYQQTEIVKPEQKNLEYMDKIIQLCKEENIPLLLVKTPYYVSQREYNILQYIKEYAAEKEVMFVDFNDLYEEMNFHFDQDGDIWHTNIRGSSKVMDKLIEILVDEFDLRAIHPENELYEKSLDTLYNTTMTKILQSVYDIYNYFDYIKNSGFTIGVSYQGTDHSFIGKHENKMLNEAGIQFDFINDKETSFIMVSRDNEILMYEEGETFDTHFKVKDSEIYFRDNVIAVNDEYTSKDDFGMKIVILDTQGNLVDALSIDHSMVFWLNNK